jgi:selenocysteine-specific elongation factor
MIIGTAGHVDHGKTALIGALTGIDTDRLKEEKERGLSIELGFAYLDLPSGERAGIVDVPGHERFVRQMLAGATGMDAALLVVAADEGVKPQTLEHLDILNLLGVARGIVAVTKADLVDDDLLRVVEQEVRETLRGTFLQEAPLVPVSVRDGRGLEELRRELLALASAARPRDLEAAFRLPLDRVFAIAGLGTIVTGTLAAGVIARGDEVELLPEGVRSRVRSIEVHGEPRERAEAGQRVAVNLPGIGRTQAERGQVLTAPGTARATRVLDTKLHILARWGKPLRPGMSLRLHIGTAEILSRLSLVGLRELRPGETCYARLHLEKPAVAARGDRFVVRWRSPMHTVGGGKVIDPYPPTREKLERRIERLEFYESAPPAHLLGHLAQVADGLALPVEDAAVRLSMTPQQVARLVEQLIEEGSLSRLEPGGVIVHAARYRGLLEALVQALEEFHARNPLRAGAAHEEIRSALGEMVDGRVLQRALTELAAQGRVHKRQDRFALAGRGVALTDDEQALARQIEQIFRQALFSPPSLDEAASSTSDRKAAQDVAQALLEEGILRRIGGIVFHREALAQAREIALRHLAEKGRATASELRVALGTSRKYALPLLEELDRLGVTRREGDERVIGARPEAEI